MCISMLLQKRRNLISKGGLWHICCGLNKEKGGPSASQNSLLIQTLGMKKGSARLPEQAPWSAGTPQTKEVAADRAVLQGGKGTACLQQRRPLKTAPASYCYTLFSALYPGEQGGGFVGSSVPLNSLYFLSLQVQPWKCQAPWGWRGAALLTVHTVLDQCFAGENTHIPPYEHSVSSSHCQK